MNDSIRVTFVNRCRGPYWSIEELFSDVAAGLPKSIVYQFVSAPRYRAKLWPIIRNLWWATGIKSTDIVHVTGDINYVVLGVRRLPVVLTIHDVRFVDDAHGLRRFLFLWLWIRLPVMRASRVTVISDFTRDRLLSLCSMSKHKLHVIPDCVSSAFQPSPKESLSETPVILHVGTTANKNLSRLVSACAGLDVVVWVLGRLSDQQKSEFSRNGVSFKEFVDLPRAKVVELYQGCDLVSFVSLYEGFGLPILEAQAVGRPVITSNISPMRDICGEGAYLVDPQSTEEIRSGLEALLTNSALRAELVSHGFENVRKYSAEAVASQYADVYRQLVPAQT